MGDLVPKSFFPRSLFNAPRSFFPSIWDAFEEEMPWDQSGLSLYEDSNKVYVEAKMPGLKSDDIDITLENGILRMEGSRKEEKEDKERKYHKKASYSYSYRISLPGQIDESKPDATYKDGIMTISFSKLRESKGKKIPIKKG